MKKQLFSLMSCLLIGTAVQAQIFFDDFERGELAPIGTPGTNWTVTERDGNNYSWHTWDTYSTQRNAATSYVDGNTDNVLTSRNITLPADNTFLSFKTSADAENPVHYAVYILNANATFQGTETPLIEETLNVGTVVALPTFITRSINIPNAYSGRTIRLCFRNFQQSGGNQLRIDDVRVETGTLSVSESTNVNKVNVDVYPNPVKNELNIKSPEKIVSTEVFDMSGRVMQLRHADSVLDLSKLGTGNYILKIETSEGITTKKIIKE